MIDRKTKGSWKTTRVDWGIPVAWASRHANPKARGNRARPLVVVALLLLATALPALGEITFHFDVFYGDCGLVTVNGGAWEDGEPITWIDWDWGDGTQFTKQFPALYRYDANGSYDVQVTAHGGSGATRTEDLTLDIGNADEPGCEAVGIQINLSEPEYLLCGTVRIDGYVSIDVGAITAVSWDWDDGELTTNVWFPAEHGYLEDGSYTVTIIATADTGEIATESVVVVISNSTGSSCEVTLELHPKQIYLRDGVTTLPVRVELRDPEGRPVDPSAMPIAWTSDDPSLVQVSEDGWVESTGFGRTKVRATHPNGRYAETEVHAGHLRTVPYLQMLSLNHQPAGAVWPDIANADGSPVDLSGHVVEYLCSGCEPGQPLQVSPDGQILAVELLEPWDPVPMAVLAVVDGQWAQNWGFVHVSANDYGLTFRRYETLNTALVTPESIGNLDLDAMIERMNAPEVLEQSFHAQRELTDGVWYGGGSQIWAHYVSPEIAGGILPPCGGSGNPIQIGTRLDEPWLSCFWHEAEPGLISPRWGIFFHELGHNFTWTAYRFADFADAGDAVAYSEGLATAASMHACEAILRLEDEPWMTPEIARSLEASGLCWRTWHVGDALADYVASGADYSTLDANVVDDILATFIDEYGYGILYRFFSIFVPRGLAYPFPMSTASEQATLFALALSEVSGVDQKSRFRDDWGFPIDDAKWALMAPYVETWVKQRDPATNAGEDKTIMAGEPVVLDDTFAFDREANVLSLTWQVVEKPAGSNPDLVGGKSLHPTFTAATPGTYVLSLTASDSWATGAPDTVEILVEEWLCVADSEVVIANRDVLADETHEACERIILGPNVRVGNGATLTLRARDYIRLDTGVSVDSGSGLVLASDPAAGSP